MKRFYFQTMCSAISLVVLWCGPIYVLTFETCLIYKTYAHKLSTTLFYFFVRLLADQHFAYIDVFAFNMT